MARPLDIAVVGAGISGLSAAWLLSKRHRVTLFEREARLGGHSNTVDVAVENGRTIPVDTGFIVYNAPCYPNLVALFAHLAIPTAETVMSFAVSLDDGAYEYSGSGARGLFGQPANALRPSHWRMLADLRRFFAEARALAAADDSERTLGDFLAERAYSDAFVRRHILPMASAIWSAPPAEVLGFPVVAFARFFANHGLLQVRNRPRWSTVDGGSRIYVAAMRRTISDRVVTGTPVQAVRRGVDGVIVTAGGQEARFDACVLATHADQALTLLADADGDERRLLDAFGYQRNRAVLHDDARFMPRRRRVWSSWNYLGVQAAGQDQTDPGAAPSVTYWMNRLQPLCTSRDLFVTLNPAVPVRPDCEIAALDYDHPVFDRAALAAQRELWRLQGRRHTWFCGSYFGSGFHEDGLQAGLAVAEALGDVRRPWQVENESGRIVLPPGGLVRVAHEAAP